MSVCPSRDQTRLLYFGFTSVNSRNWMLTPLALGAAHSRCRFLVRAFGDSCVVASQKS